MKPKDSINDIFGKIKDKQSSKPLLPPKESASLENLTEKLSQNIPLTNATLYKSLKKNDQDNNVMGPQIIKKMIKSNEFFNDKLEGGHFLLEKYQKKLKLKGSANEASEKTFGKKLERQMRFFKIPEGYAKYSLYLPMNKIWRQYISSLLENEKNDDALFLKLLKSDFHGSIIKILSSTCKSYEGLSGIVIQESMRTFKIVTKYDKIITILKQNCILLMEVLGKHVKMYGQHLCYRPSDRLKIKFKMKDTKKFILDNIEENDEILEENK